nr:MAG TPA: hypothetical protein [Caudoviricetes sp.]
MFLLGHNFHAFTTIRTRCLDGHMILSHMQHLPS